MGVCGMELRAGFGWREQNMVKTLGAGVTSECLFANSDVDGWGRLCIRAYLSLSAGFLLSQGSVVEAGRGADLFAWQV